MSGVEKDGGAAFPVVPDGGIHSYGMSLRDWFAGQALAGICANPDWSPTEPDIIARDAYAHADAMLTVRGDAP